MSNNHYFYEHCHANVAWNLDVRFNSCKFYDIPIKTHIV